MAAVHVPRALGQDVHRCRYTGTLRYVAGESEGAGPEEDGAGSYCAWSVAAIRAAPGPWMVTTPVGSLT